MEHTFKFSYELEIQIGNCKPKLVVWNDPKAQPTTRPLVPNPPNWKTDGCELVVSIRAPFMMWAKCYNFTYSEP